MSNSLGKLYVFGVNVFVGWINTETRGKNGGWLSLTPHSECFKSSTHMHGMILLAPALFPHSR